MDFGESLFTSTPRRRGHDLVCESKVDRLHKPEPHEKSQSQKLTSGD